MQPHALLETDQKEMIKKEYEGNRPIIISFRQSSIKNCFTMVRIKKNQPEEKRMARQQYGMTRDIKSGNYLLGYLNHTELNRTSRS